MYARLQQFSISEPVHRCISGAASFAEILYFLRWIARIFMRASSVFGMSKKNVPRLKRRSNGAGKVPTSLTVAIASTRPPPIASIVFSAALRFAIDCPSKLPCIPGRSTLTIGLPAPFAQANNSSDLPQPGTPRKMMPLMRLSWNHVRIEPVSLVWSPDRSVPEPANAFSISSIRRTMFGDSGPASRRRRNWTTLSRSATSASDAEPSYIESPARCAMVCRFCAHNSSVFIAPV